MAVCATGRYRYQGPNHRSLEVVAALHQKCSVAAGDRRQHDVIHRATKRGADRLHIGDAGEGVGPDPVGADGTLDRKGLCRSEASEESKHAFAGRKDGSGRGDRMDYGSRDAFGGFDDVR